MKEFAEPGAATSPHPLVLFSTSSICRVANDLMFYPCLPLSRRVSVFLVFLGAQLLSMSSLFFFAGVHMRSPGLVE